MILTAELYGRGVLGVTESDIVFSSAKLFFAYGLGNALSFPLAIGATTVLMAERPAPGPVFQRLTAHRPSVFYGVPTLYAALLASSSFPTEHRLRRRLASRHCRGDREELKDRTGVDPGRARSTRCGRRFSPTGLATWLGTTGKPVRFDVAGGRSVPSGQASGERLAEVD